VPLYEYECKKCKHRFERIRQFSDPPITTCPKCKGKVEQLLSAPAVRFKGTGWYVTDYPKKSSAQPSGSGDGGGESKSDEKSTDKSGEKSGEKSGQKKESKETKASKGKAETSKKSKD
jgi:putative FmdB family regulatory protein